MQKDPKYFKQNTDTSIKKKSRESSVCKVSKKDFTKVQLIGRGAVGKVYLVQHNSTKKMYAMKVLTKDDMIKQNKINRVLTEREILVTSQHPFIVSLYWCWQEKDAIYFVMEHCEHGDLFSLLHQSPNNCLKEKDAKFYAAEVLLALEYLHSLGYVYRDLKPENILVHSSGHLKLTDFDLSKAADTPPKFNVVKELFGDVKKISSVPDLFSNSFVGTSHYISPEMINGKGHSSSVDWWTFGVLLYEMLFGVPPWIGETQDKIFESISNAKLKFPKHIKISKDAKNLLRSLLETDVKKRLGAENGAADIKEHPFFSDVNWALIRNTKPPQPPKKQKLDKSSTPLNIPSSPTSICSLTNNDNDPFINFHPATKSTNYVS